jgi:hypothetical protein
MSTGKMIASRRKKSRKIMYSPHSEAASICDKGNGRILRKSAMKLIMSQGRTMGRFNLILFMTNSLAE